MLLRLKAYYNYQKTKMTYFCTRRSFIFKFFFNKKEIHLFRKHLNKCVYLKVS